MIVAGRNHRAEIRLQLPSASRPVMLVTFDVPVRSDAAELAVDAAVESGQPLILVNLVDLPIRPMTASWGSEVVVMEDVDASLRAPAELARTLAVQVERLRVVSPRPVRALLELVAERTPGLLILGAQASRMRKWTYRRAARKIREEAPCLVWLPT